MINEDYLINLYEGLINRDVITTKMLEQNGLTEGEITKLIESGKLTKIDEDNYSFLAINDLKHYIINGYIRNCSSDEGKERLKNKLDNLLNMEYDLSRYLYISLFMFCIINEYYDDAFKCFKKVDTFDNKFNIIDGNFYLFLLAYISVIPEEYRERVKSLRNEDVYVTCFNNMVLEKYKLRNLVLEHRFSLALSTFSLLLRQQEKVHVSDLLTKELLKKAIVTKKANYNKLLEYVKNKQYSDMVLFLEENQKRYNLDVKNKCILKLTKTLINLIDNNMMSEKKDYVATENIFEAIDDDNYRLALKLSAENNIKYNINNDCNIIDILLSQICKLSDEIITRKDNVSASPAGVLDIIDCLVKGNLKEGLKKLKEYMAFIGKSEYEFLIIDLIRISLIEKDEGFTKPMMCLFNISSDSFNLDISSYIKDFYVVFSEERYAEAKVYLDIISKIRQMELDQSVCIDVFKSLDNASRVIDDKVNKESLFDDIYFNEKKDVNKEIEKDITLDRDYRFIKKKYDILTNEKGIVLLKPMSDDKIEKMKEYINSFSNVVCYVIIDGTDKRIVLRYISADIYNISIKDTLREAQLAFNNGKIDDYINCYLKLLQIKEPKTFVYSNLGLAYLKKGDKKKAIDYLMVATQLSKMRNENIDYFDLIAGIKGQFVTNERKPYVRVRESTFKNDLEDYYGINNINEIDEYIINNGINIEEACIELGLDSEKVDVVKLIYAREYYSYGNYDMGDKLYMSIFKKKNKSSLVINLLDEIKRNRNFYVNREKNNTKKLTLNLKYMK